MADENVRAHMTDDTRWRQSRTILAGDGFSCCACPSLRGFGLAPAEVPQAAVDPQLGQLFLRAVLRQPPAQGAEIDPVEVLILVEAGEDDRLGAGRRIEMALQALSADLLHHALHRRVDRRNRSV